MSNEYLQEICNQLKQVNATLLTIKAKLSILDNRLLTIEDTVNPNSLPVMEVVEVHQYA